MLGNSAKYIRLYKQLQRELDKAETTAGRIAGQKLDTLSESMSDIRDILELLLDMTDALVEYKKEYNDIEVRMDLASSQPAMQLAIREFENVSDDMMKDWNDLHKDMFRRVREMRNSARKLDRKLSDLTPDIGDWVGIT